MGSQVQAQPRQLSNLVLVSKLKNNFWGVIELSAKILGLISSTAKKKVFSFYTHAWCIPSANPVPSPLQVPQLWPALWVIRWALPWVLCSWRARQVSHSWRDNSEAHHAASVSMRWRDMGTLVSVFSKWQRKGPIDSGSDYKLPQTTLVNEHQSLKYLPGKETFAYFPLPVQPPRWPHNGQAIFLPWDPGNKGRGAGIRLSVFIAALLLMN